MSSFRADLHVHTVLSPCADREMLPTRVAARARAVGLSIIGVCDHNSTRNVAAFQRAAGHDLAVIAGIEITTAEEVHLLGLFPWSLAAALVSEQIGATLPSDWKRLSWMSPQAVVGPDDDLCCEEPRMLSGAGGFSLAEAVRLIHDAGGLAIAAHADRPTFSVTSQLGLVPLDLGLDALEVSAVGLRAGAAARLASTGLPVIASSDSHCLDQLGGASTVFDMAAPSFAELSLALGGREGRSFHLA